MIKSLHSSGVPIGEFGHFSTDQVRLPGPLFLVGETMTTITKFTQIGFEQKWVKAKVP